MLTSNRYDRQRDMVDCDMNTRITIIGAGGIGSFTALTLAKMGFAELTVCDDDKVDVHNLPNQFYRNEDIGRPKVEALQDIIRQFSEVCITAVPHRCASNKYLDGAEIVISAVDNMETRRWLFEWCVANRVVFIDGRMGGDQAEVYVVKTIKDAEFYKTRLWYDAETAPLPCTSKATMYNVLTIASLIANNVRLALMGKTYHNNTTVDNLNIEVHHVSNVSC